MHLVLVLHAHLPYVLNHGQWAGSAPVTLSITPVLAAQMAAPEFATVVTSFLAQRIEGCEESARWHAASGEHDLARIAHWWRNWYLARQAQFEALDRGLIGALRDLEWQGRVEL